MAKKTRTKAERHHLAKVAALGCMACREIGFYDTPAEIHHIRHGQGMGQRSSDYEAIGLCAGHHRHLPNSIHQNKTLFEKTFGTERELLEKVLNEIEYKG